MHSQVMKVTPQLAAMWLESNTFNRKISPAVVKKYAIDMRNGSWTLNHQGIAFDTDGVLVDGQHRLSAIVKAGVSVEMLVTHGASRVGVDELKVRNTADVIKFGGLSDWVTPKDIQICKVLIPVFFDKGASTVISTSQVLSMAEQYKDALLFCRDKFNRADKGIHSAVCRASFMSAWYFFDHEKLAKMIKILYTGIATEEESIVVIRAREMLLSTKLTGSVDRRRAAKMICRAIESYCEGEKITKLREPKDFPFMPPEPVL